MRAIASETKSVVFDLSPINLLGDPPKFPGKESDKLIAMVFVVAKEFQPALIYIDEAEKVWPAKKKKKKGQKKKTKAEMLLEPQRLKKTLGKWRTKWVTDETRITIIACTSEPHEGHKKDFKKFFDKAIYFPFPDYTTRRLMWRTFINQRGGTLKIEFPLSTLAHISAGYSAGSFDISFPSHPAGGSYMIIFTPRLSSGAPVLYGYGGVINATGFTVRFSNISGTNIDAEFSLFIPRN